MHVADRWRCVLCRLELISAGVSGVCVVTGSAAVCRGVSVGCAHQVRATLQVRCESVFCGASCVVGTAESWRCVLSRQQCSGEVASGVCAVTRLCGSIQRCLSRVSVSGQGDTAGSSEALSWVSWETCGGWIGSSVHSCVHQVPPLVVHVLRCILYGKLKWFLCDP